MGGSEDDSFGFKLFRYAAWSGGLAGVFVLTRAAIVRPETPTEVVLEGPALLRAAAVKAAKFSVAGLTFALTETSVGVARGVDGPLNSAVAGGVAGAVHGMLENNLRLSVRSSLAAASVLGLFNLASGGKLLTNEEHRKRRLDYVGKPE